MQTINRWLEWTPKKASGREVEGSTSLSTDTFGTFGTLSLVPQAENLCASDTFGTFGTLSLVPQAENLCASDTFGTFGTLSLVPQGKNLKPPLIQNPDEWSGDFGGWALAECLFRAGCLWKIAALHDHFCDWSNARGLVPCMAETFAALLSLEGFTITTGMVHGMVLREEYKSLMEPSRQAKAILRRTGGSFSKP